MCAFFEQSIDSQEVAIRPGASSFVGRERSEICANRKSKNTAKTGANLCFGRSGEGRASAGGACPSQFSRAQGRALFLSIPLPHRESTKKVCVFFILFLSSSCEL